MESLLCDLRSLLGRQIESLKALEEVLRHQRECLVRRDVPGVIESVSRQEDYLTRIQQLEIERGRLLKEIGRVLGRRPEDVSLTELAEGLDADVGRELRATAVAIRQTLQDIGRVNQGNKRLIEHSLDFVHDMLGAIADARPMSRTYGSSGSLKPLEQSRTLVNRIT